MGQAMNDRNRADGAPRPLDVSSEIASAPPQQREAMIERVCQAILNQTDSPRAGNTS